MPRGPLSPDEVREYVDRRSEWAVLTTIDDDGLPHSVPLGYWRIGEDIYLGTPAKTHKVRNIEKRPHGNVLITSARASGEWRGVLIQGDIAIIRDDARRLEIERESRRQRGVPEEKLPTSPRRGEVILKVTPVRTRSWNISQ
jgi:nitroimidazol reductase NimA-like FMN-containing flavoprotein (pyridoxamine 5'-phosphate oxidase superfamily)